MCGIVGYIGPRKILPVLIGGLKKLEYRGYDSAGVAYLENGKLNILKEEGKLAALEEKCIGIETENTIGIGHTRWATHGAPSRVNSHPHTNEAGTIALVHNGIIENYAKIKEWLEKKGVKFVSETDTEVAAHLINHFYFGDLRAAVANAIEMIEGSYAFAVVSSEEPDTIVAVRKDSPLIVGKADGESILASDIPALLEYTRDVYFLNDNEIVEMKRGSINFYDEYGTKLRKEITRIDWDVSQAEKGGYEHFMIKEIYEQPRALQDTFSPRLIDGKIDISEMGMDEDFIRNLPKITIVACGSASHVAHVGKYIIERVAKIPVEVDIASEFRYRKPLLLPDQLVMVISQSGETADTIAALREAKDNGVKVAAVVNVIGSTIAREADAAFYTHAGMEIAVATTKAYDTQLLSMYMLAYAMAHVRGTITEEEYNEAVRELTLLPEKAENVLELCEQIQHIAYERFMDEDTFFIGRGLDYALAMEASLKLKEISYIHAEAYAAGELKHGTIALIEKNTLVVAIATQKDLIEKTISNIKEVKARGAHVICLTMEKYLSEFKDQDSVDEFILIPDMMDMMAPIIGVIPMQMLAYYITLDKGFDVDKPRNLAKSVTVE
ncbi:MAG: glutamine--fructose-6-phosphate transaminase (isomerizing) [Clostridiales bacterium]|nr:glutamine--fructose-6-phosphate transaminase (isomerizing) [Clostridiales bacterium]